MLSPAGSPLSGLSLSQPGFALMLVCESLSALVGVTGGWEGRSVRMKDSAPQKGFPLHSCPFALPGPAIALGLVVKTSPRNISVLHRVSSGPSRYVSTKAQHALYRLLSISLCRLGTASLPFKKAKLTAASAVHPWWERISFPRSRSDPGQEKDLLHAPLALGRSY